MSDEDRTDDLVDIHWHVAQVNDDLATAVQQTTSFLDHSTPPVPVRRTHDALLEAYGDLCRAIDRTENVLDRMEREDHRTRTPRSIKKAHAERLKEQYDGPVLNLALMLGEANRREWLHWKTETHGAEAVERHGLTENQREWLNQLQEAWREYEEVEQPA